jgi:CheY-like chemotaxis protein
VNRFANILIVDDEESVRSQMRDLLQNKGHRVQTAQSGFEAVEHARNHSDLEVVFLDLTMPGMDGFATLQQLHMLRPELKIIMCSSANETSTVLLSVKMGAHNYLSKPFHGETLERVLDDCLVGRHSPTGRNRRGAPRMSLKFNVRHGMAKEGSLCEGLGRELSIRGLGFLSEKKYDLGNEIDLSFKLPSSSSAVKTKGRVRDVRGNTIGAEFVNLPLCDVLKIVDILYDHT